MFYLVFTLLLTFTHSNTLYAKKKLIITGSSTIAPLMADFAKIFESQNENIRIDVQMGGSSRGLLDINKNLSQIGMISRSLKNSEKSNKKIFTIAKDGIAIIVHKLNPINNLTRNQIIKIYKDEITNWNQLGGLDQKIVVVNKAEGRSTLDIFLKFFNLKNSEIKPDIIIGDNQQGIKTVSTNANSIGYVSVGSAEYSESIGIPLKRLPYLGIDANVKNIQNGSYQLIRQLNLITKKDPKELTLNFINFVRSPKNNVTIKEHFFVPSK